jgi:hypothetical protein
MLDNIMEQVFIFKRSKFVNLLSILFVGPMGSGKTSLACKVIVDSKFGHAKSITANSLLEYNGGLARSQYINIIFDGDCEILEMALMLDDIIRLIEYIPSINSNFPPSYSKEVVHAITTLLCKKTPTCKNLIVATTQSLDIVTKLGMGVLFDHIIEVPLVEEADVIPLLEKMGVNIAKIVKYANSVNDANDANDVNDAKDAKNVNTNGLTNLPKLSVIKDILTLAGNLQCNDKFAG